MEKIKFHLNPWPDPILPDIEITGTIERKADNLAVGYHISGSLREIEIPGSKNNPERRIGLWEHTCLEFFIGEPGLSRYWEFNLSPSGDWNVFRFEHYREGLYEEMAFPELPFKAGQESSNNFNLNLEWGLEKIFEPGRALEMAISAVIENKSGMGSMWALSHPKSGPDFHHRKGFLIRL
jgi:hypothetical protein